jgi:hypothetical protein
MTNAAGGFWDAHGAHTVLLAVPIATLALFALGSDIRQWLRARGRQPERYVLLAGMLSLVAGAVHAVVCPEHFGEAALYGAFFTAAATGQVLWPVVMVVRPRRWVLAAGLAGNLAVLALWAMTRTAGIPLGPRTGQIEAVGRLDLLATLCEIGVVLTCARAMRRRHDVTPAPVGS